MTKRKVVRLTITDTLRRDVVLGAGFPRYKPNLFARALRRLLDSGKKLSISSSKGVRYAVSVSLPIDTYDEISRNAIDTVPNEIMRRIDYTLLDKNKRNPSHIAVHIDGKYHHQLCALGDGDINEGLKLLLG